MTEPDWQDDAKFPPNVRERALLACWPEIRKFETTANANVAHTHITLFKTDADFEAWARDDKKAKVKMYSFDSVHFFRGCPALETMIVADGGKRHFTFAVGVGTRENFRILTCTDYPYESSRYKLDFLAAMKPAAVGLTH